MRTGPLPAPPIISSSVRILSKAWNTHLTAGQAGRQGEGSGGAGGVRKSGRRRGGRARGLRVQQGSSRAGREVLGARAQQRLRLAGRQHAPALRTLREPCTLMPQSWMPAICGAAGGRSGAGGGQQLSAAGGGGSSARRAKHTSGGAARCSPQAGQHKRPCACAALPSRCSEPAARRATGRCTDKQAGAAPCRFRA